MPRSRCSACCPAPDVSPTCCSARLRWHDVDVEDPAAALSWLHAHPDALLKVMRTRRTQTNEVARCAAFSYRVRPSSPQPLALIEVGASAGLCLLYDAWRYHYTTPDEEHWVGPATSPVVLSCTVNAEVPLPRTSRPSHGEPGWISIPSMPATPTGDAGWSAWCGPSITTALGTLRAALDVAAEKAPKIHAGDLVTDLPMVLAQAPNDATVVVVHSATLGYVDQAKRDASSRWSRATAPTDSVLKDLRSHLAASPQALTSEAASSSPSTSRH